MESRFDLATAVATWRQFQVRRHRILEKDLDELEVHLRAHLAELLRQGWSEDAAFREAVRALGDLEEAEGEYRKVYWGKLRRQRRLMHEVNWGISMLRNYVLIALRVLKKQKLYAGLNVVGLGFGLAAFILLGLFIRYELSFDTFHQDADRIYRVILKQNHVYQGTDLMASSPAPLARMLDEELPEVTSATTLMRHTALLSYGDEHYYEEGFKADKKFLSVFSFPMLQGSAETALVAPLSIILTASLAETIFGDIDPVGESLLLDDGAYYTVTGIIEDVPEQSHFTFRFVTSIVSDGYYAAMMAAYTLRESNFFTYFRVASDMPVEDLQEKVETLTQANQSDREPAESEHFIVQTLLGIHLESHANFELGTNGDIRLIYLLAAIAFAILLLSCANYMNLAIARSGMRAHEVGMRKVVGASRAQIILQFIGESTLLSMIALGIALVIVWSLLPAFSRFVEREITLGFEINLLLPVALVLLSLGVGVISGSYPALIMSSLRPTRVLKGETGGRGIRRFRLRTFLIVGQFAISIILVVGSLIVYQQMHFIQNMDAGYDRDNLLVIPVRGGELSTGFNTLKSDLLQHSSIVGVASSRHHLLDITSGRLVRDWEGSEEGDELLVHYTSVGHDFLDLYGILVSEGRPFSTDFLLDETEAMLINESGASALGWSEPVGKELAISRKTGTIVGVVSDFHFRTLHQKVEPLVIDLDIDRIGFISVKLRSENVRESIAHIRRRVEAVSPYPFEYNFVDEVFDRQYKAELKQGRLFTVFTVLALVIATLGLFGLAAFSAEQRVKELGVRKVLGATETSLVLLLSKEYLTLIVAAFALAAPVVYFAMNRWLESFVNRVEIGPIVFMSALGLVIVIAWLSVSYQALRAARVNPVLALNCE